MELDISKLMQIAMNRKPKFVRDPEWDLVHKESGELRPHITIDASPNEPFFRVYVNLLGELFKIKSLAARNLLLWMMKEAQPDTNRVYLYADGQEEARKETEMGQAQFYASLKLLEDNGLIFRVKRGIWEINPDVMFNGAEDNRKIMSGNWRARIHIEAIENTPLEELQEAYNQS